MNWKVRSEEHEIMDDLQMEGAELIQTLQEIDHINQWLGGFGELVNILEEVVLKEHDPVTITDLGCGSGWLLKQLEKKNWPNVKLVGVDANRSVTEFAEKDYLGNIKFVNQDVFEYLESLRESDSNILVSSLFCHHFSDGQLKKMLELVEVKKTLFVVNDLQRSWLALQLFKLISLVFGLSNMAKFDGAISIKRSFTKLDWQQLLGNFQTHKYSIEWKWAFRYLVVLDLRNRKEI